MPVAGNIVHTAQAQSAIRNITRLGDGILASPLATRRIDLTANQVEQCMDVLNEFFVYNNDGWCLGRSEYGIRAMNEALLGTSMSLDARTGSFASILQPYHDAVSVREAQRGWLILDPLTSPSPQTPDEWSNAWLRMRGFAKIADPKDSYPVSYTKELVHRLGGGLKEAWAIAHMLGRVEEKPATQTRTLMHPLNDLWDAKKLWLPDRPSPSEQLTGPYAAVIEAIPT